MQNNNQGFGKVLLILIIAAAAFLYFVKDENGTPYYQKIINHFTGKIDYVQDQVQGVQDLAEKRDQEIMDNL